MTASDQLCGPRQVKLLVFGHALAYLGLLLMAVLQDERLRYVIYAGAASEVLAAIPSLRPDVMRRLRGARVLPLTLAYLAFLALLGWTNGNWFSFWAFDVLCFGVLAAVPLASSSLVQYQLRRAYGILLFPGLVAALYLLSHVSPAGIGERIVTDLDLSVYAIADLCLPAFLLLFQRDLVRREILVIVAGIGITMVFGVFTASRGTVLLVPIALVLRVALFRQSRMTTIAVVSVCLAIVGVVLSSGSSRTYATSITNLQDRLDANDDVDASSGRNDEADHFLSITTDREFVIGRGLGGAYHSTIVTTNPYGMMMVHYGHLHLILKGGIILLALMSILVATELLGVLRTGRRVPEMGFVLLFLSANVGHPTFVDFTAMSLFAWALGRLARRHVDDPEGAAG